MLLSKRNEYPQGVSVRGRVSCLYDDVNLCVRYF